MASGTVTFKVDATRGTVRVEGRPFLGGKVVCATDAPDGTRFYLFAPGVDGVMECLASSVVDADGEPTGCADGSFTLDLSGAALRAKFEDTCAQSFDVFAVSEADGSDAANVVAGLAFARGTATVAWAPFVYNADGTPATLKGDAGERGADGADGESAYEIAVRLGKTTLDEAAWIDSLKGADGADGKDGADGAAGPQGVAGPQGPQGLQGLQGPQGIQGVQGEKGETGATGPQGERGEKGEKGDTGATGPQGIAGPTGPQGPKGDKGDPGEGGASLSGVEQIEGRYTMKDLKDKINEVIAALSALLVAFLPLGTAGETLENVAGDADVTLTAELVAAVDRLGNTIATNLTQYVDISQYEKSAAATAETVKTTDGKIVFGSNPVEVTVPDGGTLYAYGAWPDSKPVFVRVVPQGDYSVSSSVRHLGYGVWPTGAWQGVVYQYGGVWYANVLVEE